jgi:hypothetical protein
MTEALQHLIVPRTRDLGDGFTVRRALPSAQKQMVGPFIFFDHMGPVALEAGRGLDVRPHPHIGLATVTYLFEGEILHRDSLGTVQVIRPGEVNWMTAGRGIAHSERSPQAAREAGPRLDGIQTWVALPAGAEETEPAFAHHGASELPVIGYDGVRLRLIAGSLYGERSPVRTFSAMFYADVTFEPGSQLSLPPEHEERAAYVVAGGLELEREPQVYEAGQLLVLKPHVSVGLRATAAGARVLLLGGTALEGPRHIWWNFVSSSKERIEQAKDDWRAGRFSAVPGETEFIPLPGDDPPAVRYP